MKFFVLAIVFVVGLILGRFSKESFPLIEKPQESLQKVATQSEDIAYAKPATKQVTEEGSVTQESSMDPRYVRTDSKINNTKIESLFGKILGAMKEGKTQEQNTLFREMESLNPNHEKVFQVKVMFLQNDGDYAGAYAVLKECVSIVPESLYCIQRLANIRSSPLEDKITYAEKCLQLSVNDPLCLVDLATSYNQQGEYEKAKSLLERALELPKQNGGFDRGYVLYLYGATLEFLQLTSEAASAFAEACKLHLKAACEKAEDSQRRKSAAF